MNLEAFCPDCNVLATAEDIGTTCTHCRRGVIEETLTAILMPTVKTYTFFADPGHAWMRVPLADVRASGAAISQFSYMNEKYAYLEEDCDVQRYLEAIGAVKVGEDGRKTIDDAQIKIKEKHCNSSSHIRTMAVYRA